VIPVIPIGFALLGGLLLWFVIGSRGRWWLKLPTIAVTSLFTFAVWNALDSFSGWPTAENPPAHALLVASTVDEPRAIYVWLVPPDAPGLLRYRPERSEPRAYRLPYSRQLHEQVDRGTALAKQGRPVELQRMQGTGSSRRTRFRVRSFVFPPQRLPRKDAAHQPLRVATAHTSPRG
jgi:hypothetical protein